MPINKELTVFVKNKLHLDLTLELLGCIVVLELRIKVTKFL